MAAVYAALNGSAGLAAQLGGAGRVYNGVPSGAPAPYVTLGDLTANDYGSTLVDGQEHSLEVHSYIEADSPRALYEIMAEVRAALHEATLSPSAGTLANIRQEFSSVMRDPDGVSFHAVQRFRIVTN